MWPDPIRRFIPFGEFNLKRYLYDSSGKINWKNSTWTGTSNESTYMLCTGLGAWYMDMDWMDRWCPLFGANRRQYIWVKWIVFSVREFIAFNVFNARARSAALIKGTCFRYTEWLKNVTENDRIDCVINSFEFGPSYFCLSRWGFCVRFWTK